MTPVERLAERLYMTVLCPSRTTLPYRQALAAKSVTAIEADLLAAEALAEFRERLPTPEALAQKFHDFYEAIAPQYGYKTREASAVPWDKVPELNRKVMVATCSAILDSLTRTVGQ